MIGTEQKNNQPLVVKKGRVEKDWYDSTSEDVPKEVKVEVYQVLEECRKLLGSIFND